MDNDDCIFVYSGPIIPNLMIYKNEFYDIKTIDKELVINGYELVVRKNKLKKVYLNNPHPNCNPMSNEFCLPDDLADKELSSDLIEMIEYLIKIYNIDSCYFSPWDKITYQKRVAENDKKRI